MMIVENNKYVIKIKLISVAKVLAMLFFSLREAILIDSLHDWQPCSLLITVRVSKNHIRKQNMG